MELWALGPQSSWGEERETDRPGSGLADPISPGHLTPIPEPTPRAQNPVQQGCCQAP